MSIRKILTIPDPILRKKSLPVKNLNKEIKDEDKSAKTSSSTTSTSDLAVEEPISEDDEQMEE